MTVTSICETCTTFSDAGAICDVSLIILVSVAMAHKLFFLEVELCAYVHRGDFADLLLSSFYA